VWHACPVCGAVVAWAAGAREGAEGRLPSSGWDIVASVGWMASAQELDSGVRASSAIFADDRCLLCPRVGWCGGVRLKNFAA
jgi:hypothetical protein